ncbi:MAG: cell division protein SepF [Selenomonadaceae bacterium]|nr:cell division protein SepF [Selenomonadaceae bacterium]
MKLIDSILDYIMPPPAEEEDLEDEIETKAPEKSVKKVEPIVEKKIEQKAEVIQKPDLSEQLRVGNGESIPISSEPVSTTIPSFTGTSTFQPKVVKSKAQQHSAKVAELSVKIYTPIYFNEMVQRAADDLLSKCAVVVNYEQSNAATQQRITDFLDGVCYIKDGTTRKISDKIILYAPNGVDTEAALSVAMN